MYDIPNRIDDYTNRARVNGRGRELPMWVVPQAFNVSSHSFLCNDIERSVSRPSRAADYPRIGETSSGGESQLGMKAPFKPSSLGTTVLKAIAPG